MACVKLNVSSSQPRMDSPMVGSSIVFQTLGSTLPLVPMTQRVGCFTSTDRVTQGLNGWDLHRETLPSRADEDALVFGADPESVDPDWAKLDKVFIGYNTVEDHLNSFKIQLQPFEPVFRRIYMLILFLAS